jgi:Zn-dependent protease with chaperone function
VAEEMKISSGLKALKIYVIPSVNINSISLIDSGNIPAIAVTEGLLAEASRDELEAVIAQNIAHIIKGDTFLLTMVCSLAYFYERLLEATEKEEDYGKDVLARTRKQGAGQPLIYLAGFLSNLLFHFLSA